MKIRKKNNLIELLFVMISLFYAFYRIQFSDEKHKIGVEIFVSFIVIFGFGVKIILNFLVPQIIIDDKGIKFIGRRKIYWKEIKSIVVESSNDSDDIIVMKLNNKKIRESFKNLNISSGELQIIMNDYLKQNGFNFQ